MACTVAFKTGFILSKPLILPREYSFAVIEVH